MILKKINLFFLFAKKLSMASESDSKPRKTLTSVSISDLKPNEFVALEVLENGGYDRALHPRMGMRRQPIFERKPNGWMLLTTYGDELLEKVGWPKRQSAIIAYLDTLLHVVRFADFDVEAYNRQAGEEALVVDVDYKAVDACALSRVDISDKSYYIVDGLTYIYSTPATESDRKVDVISFDGKRVPEIEEEEARIFDEALSKEPRRLFVDCEGGHFVASMMAHDSIVLQYDMESRVYVPKQASATRLYLLYGADKEFFNTMSPDIMRMHVSPVISNSLYSQVDNLTISVSLLLLELLYPDQNRRRQQRDELVAHNLTVLESKGLVSKMRDTEFRYIEIEDRDFDKHRQLFFEVLGRELSADFLY